MTKRTAKKSTGLLWNLSRPDIRRQSQWTYPKPHKELKSRVSRASWRKRSQNQNQREKMCHRLSRLSLLRAPPDAAKLATITKTRKKSRRMTLSSRQHANTLCVCILFYRWWPAVPECPSSNRAEFQWAWCTLSGSEGFLPFDTIIDSKGYNVLSFSKWTRHYEFLFLVSLKSLLRKHGRLSPCFRRGVVQAIWASCLHSWFGRVSQHYCASVYMQFKHISQILQMGYPYFCNFLFLDSKASCHLPWDWKVWTRASGRRF